MKFDNRKIYIDTVFNVPVNSRFIYYYKGDYFDSTNNKRLVYITKLVALNKEEQRQANMRIVTIWADIKHSTLKIYLSFL